MEIILVHIRSSVNSAMEAHDHVSLKRGTAGRGGRSDPSSRFRTATIWQVRQRAPEARSGPYVLWFV